jgi:hypothetical protein
MRDGDQSVVPQLNMWDLSPLNSASFDINPIRPITCHPVFSVSIR